MAIQNDISIAANGDIRYTGTVDNYTVIEFHRWLGDLMDDAQASGDDLLDITDATASERSTDNIITLNAPYNIDDTMAQHLYDGSIVQDGQNTIYDGILVFAPPGTYLEIIQSGSVVTPNFWTNGLNANDAAGISHRFMLKVRSGGVDIDGRRLIGQTREWGYSYSQFPINGTARGNNVIALSYAQDLNNQTASASVATWTTITNIEGYQAIDIDGNPGTTEYYYSQWNTDEYTINQFYERMKYLTRRGTSETLYGLNGELFRGITHEVPVTNQSITDFNAVEKVRWAGGTGAMLAIDDVNAATKMWIQLLTGVAPSSGSVIIGDVTAASASVSAAPTERPLSFPFCGQSTGTAIIGAYGLGIEPLDLSASDKVTDLSNTQRTPPNNVTFTVSGLVAGEDRVLVGPGSASVLQTNQFLLSGTLSAPNVTEIVVNTAIPTDTPSSGSIRVERDSGIYSRIDFSSYTGSTFTVTSTDFSSDNASDGNDVYISYMDRLANNDEISFTTVYLADRSLFVRVRDGGASPIKTFETTATLGSAGGSSTVIRTSDQ